MDAEHLQGNSDRNDLEQAQRTIRELYQRLALATTKQIAAEDRANRYSEHIIAIRKSLSWRLTRPIRAIRRRMR